MSLLTGIGLLLLWVLVFVLYIDYRVDSYRQKLFTLRDELFDFAHKGNIDFDNTVYQDLRTLINGSIRFAHRVNFPYFLCLALGDFLFHFDKTPTNRMRDWDANVAKLPQETAQHLIKVRRCLHHRVIEQIILTSPLLLITVVSLVLLILSYCASHAIKRKIQRFFGPFLNPILKRFDDSACYDALLVRSSVHH